MGNTKIKIEKSILFNLYWRKGLSANKISKIFNCSYSTITNRLKENNIKIKNNSLARQRYQKNDFSKNSEEKAYIMGFRIGDLNVYKTKPESETVVVRCHTTDKAQVKLIQRCFEKYGQVTISCKLGHYHINCFLNKSFNYLLKKFIKPPISIKTKAEIFAFIAGYTDAEGNFILNQGRARFKIDSYDKLILFWINNKLKKFGIKNKIRLLGNQNLLHYGMKINQELWRLNINYAEDLLNFINLIDKYIKHDRRKHQIQLMKRNILNRLTMRIIK